MRTTCKAIAVGSVVLVLIGSALVIAASETINATLYRQFELHIGAYFSAYFDQNKRWPSTSLELRQALAPEQRALFDEVVERLDIRISMEEAQASRCTITVVRKVVFWDKSVEYDWSPSKDAIRNDAIYYGARHQRKR